MKISIENIQIQNDKEFVTIGLDENTQKVGNALLDFLYAIPKVKNTLDKLEYEKPHIGESITIKTNLLCQLKKQKAK